MPALPEIPATVGLVGAVEVLRQAVAHEQGHADRHVGVSAEVGVDLQGVAIEGHQHLKAAVRFRGGEDPVVEVHGNPVRQQHLFQQSVEHPETGETHGGSGDPPGIQDLGHELRGANDGAGHELGEEGDVESEIGQPVQRDHLPPSDVHRVADGLEGVEADAHGQQDAVDRPGRAERGIGPHGEPVSRNDVAPCGPIPCVGQEVGVLEIEEQAEVQGDAQGEPCVAAPIRIRLGNPVSDQVVAEGGKHQDAHEPARGLPVEQQTGEEQPPETEGPLAVPVPESVHQEDAHEEHPEPRVEEGPGRAGIMVEEVHPVHHGARAWSSAARTRVSYSSSPMSS